MKWLVVVVALVEVAHAQPDSDTVAYRVKKNDSLELVAAEFYGDRGHQILLVEENKLQKPRSLQQGDRLRVPVTREITTVKGDTFESLANTYLGDSRRAQFLADFNQMSADADPVLPTGTAITIPMHVTHTATAPESISQVAVAYLGEAKQADMIRRYNFTDKTQLDKGESIVVPVLTVRVRPGKLPAPDAEAKQRRDARSKAVAEAATALPRARMAWLEGNFAAVRELLKHPADQLEYLDTQTAAEVGLLLGKAMVADDMTDQAVERFSQVLNRKPRQLLGAYADSPKVIAAWKKAGGRIAAE